MTRRIYVNTALSSPYLNPLSHPDHTVTHLLFYLDQRQFDALLVPFARVSTTATADLAVTAAVEGEEGGNGNGSGSGGAEDNGVDNTPSSSSTSSSSSSSLSSQVLPAAYRYYIPNPYLTPSPRGQNNNNDSHTELRKKYDLMSRKRSDLKRALNWQKRLAKLANKREKDSDKLLLEDGSGGGGEEGSEQMVRRDSNNMGRVGGGGYDSPTLLEVDEDDEDIVDDDDDDDDDDEFSSSSILPPFEIPSYDEWLLAWSVFVTPFGEVLTNGSASEDGLMPYGRAMILAAGRHILRCVATPSPTLLDAQVREMVKSCHVMSDNRKRVRVRRIPIQPTHPLPLPLLYPSHSSHSTYTNTLLQSPPHANPYHNMSFLMSLPILFPSPFTFPSHSLSTYY